MLPYVNHVPTACGVAAPLAVSQQRWNGSWLRTAANHARNRGSQRSAGVNLGGWLLLEPGPSYPLFTHHLLKDKSQAATKTRVSPITALLNGLEASQVRSTRGAPL